MTKRRTPDKKRSWRGRKPPGSPLMKFSAALLLVQTAATLVEAWAAVRGR